MMRPVAFPARPSAARRASSRPRPGGCASSIGACGGCVWRARAACWAAGKGVGSSSGRGGRNEPRRAGRRRGDIPHAQGSPRAVRHPVRRARLDHPIRRSCNEMQDIHPPRAGAAAHRCCTRGDAARTSAGAGGGGDSGLEAGHAEGLRGWLHHGAASELAPSHLAVCIRIFLRRGYPPARVGNGGSTGVEGQDGGCPSGAERVAGGPSSVPAERKTSRQALRRRGRIRARPGTGGRRVTVAG